METVDDVLETIEDLNSLRLEETSVRKGRKAVTGTADYPGPYSDIARFMDEDERRGWKRVRDRSPRLPPEAKLKLYEVFRKRGMSVPAARRAVGLPVKA